jgi:hypothetical protein
MGNSFQALSDHEILGSDGNPWLESGPFGKVPLQRLQIDGNVEAFQALPQWSPGGAATPAPIWPHLSASMYTGCLGQHSNPAMSAVL